MDSWVGRLEARNYKGKDESPVVCRMFLEYKTAQGNYSSRIASVVTQDICTFFVNYFASILQFFDTAFFLEILGSAVRHCGREFWDC